MNMIVFIKRGNLLIALKVFSCSLLRISFYTSFTLALGRVISKKFKMAAVGYQNTKIYNSDVIKMTCIS